MQIIKIGVANLDFGPVQDARGALIVLPKGAPGTGNGIAGVLLGTANAAAPGSPSARASAWASTPPAAT